MSQVSQPSKDQISSKMLYSILEEVKLLREEVMLLLPQEDIEEYSHPKRISGSYRKALKKFPPVFLWK